MTFKTTLSRVFAVLSGVVSAIALTSLTAFAQLSTDAYIPENKAEWVLQQGDWIIANVEENTLQYVREDHSEVSEPIAIGSGINDGKKMYYLGMSYDPKTPEGIWEVRSKNQQNWWTVFGSEEANEQLFLRLYRVQGERRIYSHYGIHTTPDIDRILAEEQGYGSWGCVLTKYDDLKLLEKLYHINGESLKVVTTRQSTDEIVSLLQNF